MRKLTSLVLSALLVLGYSIYAGAEMSATGYSGKVNTSQMSLVDMYNNSGIKLTENTVVILDTSAGLTDSKIGSYVTVATATDSVYVIGVLDEDVLSANVGRICVRGPHKVLVATESAITVGLRLGTANTVSRPNAQGYAVTYTVADGTAGGRLGIALQEAQATPTSIWWIWVDPKPHQ